MKKKGIRLVVLIILLIVIILLEGIVIIKLKTNQSLAEFDKKDSLEINKLIEKKQNNKEYSNEYFNDKLISYVLDLIKTYAENGYILKLITGDATSEKLSRAECIEKREEYKIAIEKLIDDRNYFGEIYENNNSKECIFNFIKILESLGLSSNQGVGIGIHDSKGNKFYKLNDEKFETDIPTNLNIIDYFNKDTIILVDSVINKILVNIDEGILVNKENESLISSEMAESKEYRDKIIEILNDKEIFTEIIYENGTLKVSYNYSAILNNLNIKINNETDNILVVYEF